ncbi:MAG: DUF2927 domain-containing protein [Paracoccus sp. (in: a-proteobacteria)]|uniref:DUF2927 domain-containing protein n=1 Tax=Paracoccus sp. TaxID=267 RepID=UPI0026DF7A31|nr:DUF2927 domain-containing protein [Paracoccus sp. (in: a-proteobacteria)]MDO5630739.1 DUF2927 domain-containing protein [Paracoccus sp. (in: a-proteobacteria)]
MRRGGLLGGLALAVLLAGCAARAPDPGSEATAPAPVAAPTPPAPKPDRPARPTQAELMQARAEAARQTNRAATSGPTAASRNMRLYLATAEAGLLSRGKLRMDTNPRDIRFDAATLAQNFFRIALRNEYAPDGRRHPDGQETPAPLRRWTQPIRLQLEFGASSDMAAQRRDRAEIGGYAARLARASGHPVSLASDGGNFIVLILSEDERRAIGPRLERLIPGIPAEDVAAIRNLSPQNYCAAFAYSRGGGPEYVNAVAILRAELPARLRTSCIHEELAQGMGLAADSLRARPSIFNDDEEFARLTRHDELLLRILYDPRLRPGMTQAQAEPIVHRIAAELTGGS